MPANFFSSVPDSLPDELMETLVAHPNVRIERIISTGHSSPTDFWYDQDEHEWVIVLQGQAKIAFADPARELTLGPGDFLEIPAHQRHRIDWTSDTEPTVWLAVFYRSLD